MTKQESLSISGAFNRMGKKGWIPKDKGCGLCSNFGGECSVLFGSEYYAFLKEWPLYSGSNIFPVPSGDKRKNSRDAYMTAKNCWAGKYGDNRRNLARFLAKKYAALAKSI